MTHGQVAKSVRERKEQKPERYCSNAKCLFSLADGKVCPKHQAGKTFEQVMAEYRKQAEGQITYYTNLGAQNGQNYAHYIAEAHDRIARIAAFDPNAVNNLFEKLSACDGSITGHSIGLPHNVVAGSCTNCGEANV